MSVVAIRVAVVLSLTLGSASAEETKPIASQSQFTTNVLAGDGVNELRIPLSSDLVGDVFSLDVKWDPKPEWMPAWACSATSNYEARDALFPRKSTEIDQKAYTNVNVFVPAAPCWLPPVQTAQLTISGNVREAVGKNFVPATFFKQAIGISVFWFPLLITLLAVIVIYPGCALIS